jgi:hypothetical protein
VRAFRVKYTPLILVPRREYVTAIALENLEFVFAVSRTDVVPLLALFSILIVLDQHATFQQDINSPEGFA